MSLVAEVWLTRMASEATLLFTARKPGSPASYNVSVGEEFLKDAHWNDEVACAAIGRAVVKAIQEHDDSTPKASVGI